MISLKLYLIKRRGTNMAKLIDKGPKYEGEKIVWHAFSSNLPQHWVVYNTRSVNGREYDFCVMAPDFGLFIIEVKGWVSYINETCSNI